MDEYNTIQSLNELSVSSADEQKVAVLTNLQLCFPEEAQKDIEMLWFHGLFDVFYCRHSDSTEQEVKKAPTTRNLFHTFSENKGKERGENPHQNTKEDAYATHCVKH